MAAGRNGEQLSSGSPHSADHVVIVVLQHGSHGHASDFDNIRKQLEGAWRSSVDLSCWPLEIWTTSTNEGLSTDLGLVACGDKLAAELGAALRDIAIRYPSATMHMCCVAHSFGGLLIRHALAMLDKSGGLDSVNLNTFITLASPHVGARQLDIFLRMGARMLGAAASTAYQDLLLDSSIIDELCSEQALSPLRRFDNRILYNCAAKDHLVKFETGSLVVVQGGMDVSMLPDPIEGHPHVRQALCLDPFDSDMKEDQEARKLRLLAGGDSNIHELVCQRHISEAFSGYDDSQNVRAQRAARMLYLLRSVGRWCLHVVQFPEVTVLNGHGAIINHPAKSKNMSGAGADIANHVAKQLCKGIRDAIGVQYPKVDGSLSQNAQKWLRWRNPGGGRSVIAPPTTGNTAVRATSGTAAEETYEHRVIRSRFTRVIRQIISVCLIIVLFALIRLVYMSFSIRREEL